MQASPRVCGVFDQFKRGYGSLSRFLFPMADDRAAPASSTAAAADSLVKLCFSVVDQSPPKPSGDSPMQKAPVAGPTSRKARAKRDVSGRRDAQSCNDVRPQRGAGSPGGGETKSQSLLDAAAVIDGGAPHSPARRGDRSSESGSEKEGNTLEAGAIRCVCVGFGGASSTVLTIFCRVHVLGAVANVIEFTRASPGCGASV